MLLTEDERTAEAGASGPDRGVRILLVFLACLVPIVIVLAGRVHYTVSDPSGTLLVSEQILVNGDMALDPYGPEVTDPNWRVFTHDGRTYYYFPLGSPLASLPFVAIGLAAGMDLRADEGRLQVLIAALVAAACVLLMHLIARQFLPFMPSLLLSVAFWAGTSMASTNGSALWSHAFAVLFELAALLSMLYATRRSCTWCWIPLGLTLFLSYLTRPTTSIMVVAVLVYTAFVARRTALLAALVVAGLMGILMLFSSRTFGAILPPYYLPDRLANDDIWNAIAGNLVSPGRGLLTFTPILLMLPVLALVTPDNVRRRWGLLLLTLAWPLAHLIAISRFPIWHGGHAFGPRLMTDALPALFLATVLLWPPSPPSRRGRAAIVAWSAMAVISIAIHTGKGLFDPYSFEWNVGVEVGPTDETIWDWRYPQFLHDAERHVQRNLDYGLPPP